MTIEELAKRLASSGPNFSIDDHIGSMFEPTRSALGLPPRKYTSCLNDAMTLADYALPGELVTLSRYSDTHSEAMVGTSVSGLRPARHRSPALAVCLAVLQAAKGAHANG